MNKEPWRLSFFMALDPTEYWGMIREWFTCFYKPKKRLPKNETRQSDPEWKGNIVLGLQGLQ